MPAAGRSSACPKRTGNNPLLYQSSGTTLCAQIQPATKQDSGVGSLEGWPLVKEGQIRWDFQRVLPGHVHSNARARSTKASIHRAEREGELSQTQAAIIVDGRTAGTICTFVRMRSARLNQQFSHYPSFAAGAGAAQESSRLRFAFRKSHVRSFCRRSGRSSPCIGEVRGLRDGRCWITQALGSRQPSPAIPGLGWEEKKIKTSWGGNSVDHEKLAEVQIRAMPVADLNRLL